MPPRFARDYLETPQQSSSTRALLGESSDEEEERDTRRATRPGDAKIKKLKGELKEVTTIMKENISKTLDRGDKIADIEDRSEHLVQQSAMFSRKAKKVGWQMWFNNMKLKLYMAAAIIIILLIIIIPIVVHYKKN